MQALDCDVVDVGFISDAEDGARAAEQLRVAGCDLIVGFLTTYMTASMLVPIAQRSGAPVLLINLQPTEAMDHATFDTGQWLAYCGACPLPEMANTFLRWASPFRSVSGYLEDERAWAQDRPVDQGRRRARRAAARPARADGPPVPGHARRLDRPDPGARELRRPRGGARVRRPARAGRGGHRRRGRRADGARRATSSRSTTRCRTRTSAGRRRSRSGSTGWSTTSGWTASPTTTAGSRASSTSGSARA